MCDVNILKIFAKTILFFPDFSIFFRKFPDPPPPPLTSLSKTFSPDFSLIFQFFRSVATQNNYKSRDAEERQSYDYD